MQGKSKELHYGWTTGTCATAAAKAAYYLFSFGYGLRGVSVTLPKGQGVSLPIKNCQKENESFYASVVKDAGDDPDVTDGALIECWIRPGVAKEGMSFCAGEGVGTVTLPGLPLAIGEAAINPIPRQMIKNNLTTLNSGKEPNIEVTIGVKNGQELAKKTLNGRLGIKGGLSILGTTGIVIPFSCAAWIETIHRSVDVARALGYTHLVGATGDISGKAALSYYQLPAITFIEMGDFIGGFLKYIRRHPVKKITIAGGPGKITKVAQGQKDLRAKRCRVDKGELLTLARTCHISQEECERMAQQPSVGQMFGKMKGEKRRLGDAIAQHAFHKIMHIISPQKIQCDVMIVDRNAQLIGAYCE